MPGSWISSVQESANVYIKSGVIIPTDFSGNPKKYTVVFAAPFADTDYAITVTGMDQRSWTWESRTVNGFTINAGASAALTGSVAWTASKSGER